MLPESAKMPEQRSWLQVLSCRSLGLSKIMSANDSSPEGSREEVSRLIDSNGEVEPF